MGNGANAILTDDQRRVFHKIRVVPRYYNRDGRSSAYHHISYLARPMLVTMSLQQGSLSLHVETEEGP